MLSLLLPLEFTKFAEKKIIKKHDINFFQSFEDLQFFAYFIV